MKKIDKRSPLRHGPLRLPGQSLDEERSRIFDDEVLPALMYAGFFVVFAALEWWRWFTKDPPHPVPLSVVAAGLLVYAVMKVRRSLPRVRALRLGAEGEKVVGQFLETSREQGWTVFHDLQGEGFNVDHVLVTPRGVFAVETKTFSKPIGRESKVEFDGERIRVNGIEPDRNPLKQARAARDWVSGLLFELTGRRFPVKAVVIFPGWWVESSHGARRSDVWVLNEKAFVKFVANESAVIEPEDVALVCSRIAGEMAR